MKLMVVAREGGQAVVTAQGKVLKYFEGLDAEKRAEKWAMAEERRREEKRWQESAPWKAKLVEVAEEMGVLA